MLDASYGSKIIMLTGSAGVGKTIICKNVVSQVLSKARAVASDIPCVYIQAGATGDNRFDWKDFFNRLLIKIGDYLIDSKAIPLSRESQYGASDIINFAKAKRTKRDLQLVVEDVLRMRNIQVLIIDEAQHIFQGLSEKIAYREMEYIKSFAEFTGLKIILSGTYNLLRCTKVSAQFSRRLRVINVPRYDVRQKKHAAYFFNVFNEFLRHYPAQYNSYFHKDVELFYTYSCGCIGILKDLLTNALLKSASNDFKVGYDEVNAVALHPDGLLRIIHEISVGEKYFKDNDLSKVKKFLGIDSTSDKSLSKKKVKSAPGRRSPVRDQTGSR